MGAGRVHLPEMEMHTTSFWWELPDDLVDAMAARGQDLGDALKGLAHLLGRVAPVFIMADPSDLHATAMVRSPFTGRPTLYLYDSFPGGVGFARRIFDQFEEICGAAASHVRGCPCERGLPVLRGGAGGVRDHGPRRRGLAAVPRRGGRRRGLTWTCGGAWPGWMR